jgi:hypothetical protein
MKLSKRLPSGRVIGCLALALALLSPTPTARANVYATDIKLNGSLSRITNTSGTTVNISYILNEPATAGVTINILSGNTVADTIQIASPNPGTALGLNTVPWGGTNSAGALASAGTYSVSITAASTGYAVWTQTSLDSTNNVAVDAEGIAVDNNTNSPYYGRIMLGSATPGTQNGVTQQCGIYKMNADGSPADEGSFGYGGYTNNDAGVTATGQMPYYDGYIPWRLRIGADDRLYMLDYTSLGAVIAFDIKVTTSQIVIDDGNAGTLGGPSTYTSNPDFDMLETGINNFDVATTANAVTAVCLCDGDSPNWGIWVYHLKNGAADPADTVGTQAVISSANSDLNYGSSGGCMVDTNLDIFVSESLFATNSDLSAMDYAHWNNGILPPEDGGSTYADGKTTSQVLWGVGANDVTFESVQDTVINSRQHPTMVALPMEAGNDDYPGIRVLNSANGSVVTVTNSLGVTNQILTNLDYPNQYTCAAWDNVGNLYGASSSIDLWRVWSPPGSNQATTLAVATMQLAVPTPPYITSIAVSGNLEVGGAVTINFTAGPTDPASAFTLISSATVNGPYTPVSSAMITGGSGSYQARAGINGSVQFYQVER